MILAVARGAHLVALLSLFGTLIVAALIRPAVLADASADAGRLLDRKLALLLQGSGVGILLTGLAWLSVQAADMAGATTVSETLTAMPIALLDTQFGEALLVRMVLVLVAMALARQFGRDRRIAFALVPAAIAVVAQSWMGHPAAAGDNVLLAASMLHLLAAGAWLGALVPLYWVVKATPGQGAARAATRFSWIGQVSVLTLAVTAFVQGWSLIGDEAGMAGTEYGRLATLKLVLFGVLFLFAVVNRFKLSPMLEGTDAARANHHLTTSIVIETGVGLLVVLAAGWLATLTPAAHEQPLWPFPLRPNKALLADPDVRNAFIEAAVLLLIAVCLAGRAALFRRWRWPILALMAGLIWYSNKVIDDAPFLDPILIEASPVSYYQSPTGFTSDSVAQGAHLFAENCVPCHGVDGRGDGPAAAGLPVPPANLALEHVWGHSDGEMFWWLTKGIEVRGHGIVMPAFGEVLSDDDRWALIDYIHAHLAGATMAGKGLWTVPAAAPSVAAVCSDGMEFDLKERRGSFVRVIALGPNDVGPPPSNEVVVLLTTKRVETPGCVAEGDVIWDAYAVMAHVAPDQLAGTQFLIDPSGWVRWSVGPQDAAAWSNPAELRKTIAVIASHPLAAGGGGGHHHH
jgi:putative copper export protein